MSRAGHTRRCGTHRIATHSRAQLGENSVNGVKWDRATGLAATSAVEEMTTTTRSQNDGPWPHLVAYCTAIVLYVVGAFTPGLQAPFPWQGCLICEPTGSSPPWTRAVLCAMWCLHYSRRALESVCLFKFFRVRDWSERLAFIWCANLQPLTFLI